MCKRLSIFYPSYVDRDKLEEALNDRLLEIKSEAEKEMRKRAEIISIKLENPIYYFALINAAMKGYITLNEVD